MSPQRPEEEHHAGAGDRNSEHASMRREPLQGSVKGRAVKSVGASGGGEWKCKDVKQDFLH